MIWIATLCMLAIAAWLFFNASNERRWVQVHSHDETVASDEGILPNFTARTRTAMPQGDAKVSIDQENTRFARAVVKVQSKTRKYGDRFFEQKAAAARLSDTDQRPASVRDEDTFFGRAVAKVGARAERVDQKLEVKMKQASSAPVQSASGSQPENEGSFFDRAARKVARTSDEISARVANRARLHASGLEDRGAAGDNEGLFGKVVSSVSSKMETMDRKVQQRLAAGRTGGTVDGAEKQDLISRVSAKVGSRINELDAKIVDRPGNDNTGGKNS
jgi:hypothetical protein